ncbi:hypothetical protein V491_03919, partial [Pseudogymnoascus sp. VKM F-3775]
PPKGATLIPSISAFPGQPRTGALCSANHREAKQDYLQRGYSSFEATEEPEEAGKKEKVMEDSQPSRSAWECFKRAGEVYFPRPHSYTEKRRPVPWRQAFPPSLGQMYSPVVAMDIAKVDATEADSKVSPKTDSKSDEEYEMSTVEHLDSEKHPPPYVQSTPTGGVRRVIPPALVAAMSLERRAEAEKALVRKIDIRLMPMIVLMYIMNYLDRNNIAAARLGALEEDLNLRDNEYATCISILFVGYVLMQIPSNLYLNKIGKPAIFLPSCMVVWGVISTATAACHNFGGLVACRFMLGFVEAAYFPGCLYYLSCWYTRAELGFRYSILYSGALISGAFSGLLAAGIVGNMDHLHGLRSWRWLFIIEGTITIGIAAAAFFILPNFPRTTTWLSEEERQLAAWRMEEDIGEDDWINSESQSFLNGIKLALIDIKTWILLVILFGIVSSGSVTSFFPSVVGSLNFTNVQTLLLTVPPYVLCVITTYINAWHADRTGERFYHIVLPLSVAVIAFILAAATTSTAPRYVAMMLMIPGLYCGYTVALGWISNTLPRPAAKRAAAIAFINCISNVASIYTSYMYIKPKFTIAMIVNCITAAMSILTAAGLRFMLIRLNKQMDAAEAAIVEEGEEVDQHGIPINAAKSGFRYKY